MITEKENKPYERRTKTAAKALADLMRYASRAERSCGDAMRLMRTWGVPEGDRAGVLARLVKDGFINDNRFAAAYVREKSGLSGWGVHKIRTGLRGKGIPKDIIEQAIASEYRQEDAVSRLEDIITKKMKCIKGGTKYEIKGKLFRFALSRGYEYDAVADVVERIVGASDEF